jgi:hypothetical protein
MLSRPEDQPDETRGPDGASERPPAVCWRLSRNQAHAPPVSGFRTTGAAIDVGAMRSDPAAIRAGTGISMKGVPERHP